MKYYVVIEVQNEMDLPGRLELAAQIADQWQADVTVWHSVDDLVMGEEEED